MPTKFVLVALFGAGTIAAATAGGYVALRRNTLDRPPAVVTDVPVETSGAVVEPPRQQDVPAPPESSLTSAPVASASAPAPRQPRASAPARRKGGEPIGTATASNQTTAAAPAPAAPAPAPAPAPVSDASRVEPKDARLEPAPAPVYEPVKPRVEELTVAPDAVIGIRLESAVSSETAKVEDKVSARVARDVVVDGRTAIAAGTRLDGVIASLDRGGKFKDRARIGLRFESLVLADGMRLPIQTETIYRESESPTRSAATKVGASAAVGGILGAVIGGKKGAAIGATVGAAGGSGAVMAGAPATATFPAGTPLTVRLTQPLTLTVQKEN